jgi:hypothetical protein
MRAAPTLNVVSNFRLSDQGAAFAITSLTLDAARTGTMTGEFRAQTASGLTTNRIYNVNNNNSTTASLDLSAEL